MIEVHHVSLAHYLPMMVVVGSNTIFLGLNHLQQDTNHK